MGKANEGSVLGGLPSPDQPDWQRLEEVWAALPPGSVMEVWCVKDPAGVGFGSAGFQISVGQASRDGADMAAVGDDNFLGKAVEQAMASREWEGW